MKTFLSIVAGLIVLGLIAVAVLIWWPLDRTSSQELTLANDVMIWPEVDHYPTLAVTAADCAACHTAEGGEPFAGGRAFPTPMGTIYAPNITPDRETGIGTYTLAKFRTALVDGVRQDGKHLYPAMPYTNYRNLAERDVAAIYEYMMDKVEPVRATNRDADMIFPFNLRFGVRAWKWLSIPDAGFDAPADPVLARGAYLVEGPEHCGACHSPRNLLYVQDGYTAADAGFLSGGELNGWTVPSLRGDTGAPGRWSAEELRAYLRTGRNAETGTAGEMTDVIRHSLQNLPDSDLDAMVAYLRALAPNGGGVAEAVAVGPGIARARALWAEQDNSTTAMLTAADPNNLDLGARLYLDNCSGCHFADGQGADRVFPRLDGNRVVNGDGVAALVKTILNGAALPSTHDAPYAIRMPGFGNRLSDIEVAALATFIRGAWTNVAGPVEADAIGGFRDE